MSVYPSARCYDIVYQLAYEVQFNQNHPKVSSITTENVSTLFKYCVQAQHLEDENTYRLYSKPMVSIGIYIAVASIFCIIAMGADLLHGFRNIIMFFPSKYFTLNAASLTVITVAMKLPVDLSGDMPGALDQATKLGSMAFMCVMMANLMPSLGSMDNKTLLANVIGLTILVITMVVNICIEITTGVIYNSNTVSVNTDLYPDFKVWAYIYVATLLWLLVIMISSAITIPSSKQIIKFKYQVMGKRDSDDQENSTSTVEKLRQCVRRYWVMEASGRAQLVMGSTQFSPSILIICVYILVLEVFIFNILRFHFLYLETTDNESDYKWSMVFICTTQLIGVVVGIITLVSRHVIILVLKFNMTKWNKNAFMMFKVEEYWIQMLCEWKEGHITFLSSGSGSKTDKT